MLSVCCSAAVLPRSGKGRPAPLRRSTVDDRVSGVENGISCRKNSSGTLAKPTSKNNILNFFALNLSLHLPADSEPQMSADDVPQPRGGASPVAASRPQSRRAESAGQVRRETLPRPLLRQQTQLVRQPECVNVDLQLWTWQPLHTTTTGGHHSPDVSFSSSLVHFCRAQWQ